MDEKLINKAMLFTANHFNNSCHNFGKPVFFHCVKVAMQLFNLGYSEKIVVGGILHDLIEDTDCSLNEIHEQFGEEMAKLIEVLSFNPNIEDKFEQSKQMLDASFEYGKDALIIKCIDMYENGKFFHLVTKSDIKEYLVKKYQYFTDLAKPVIANEPAFILYEKLASTIRL